MNEHDPLHSVLREWEAPQPSPAMDARALANFRGRRPPFWRRFWSFRVSIPVPVLTAVLLVMAAGLWLQSRSRPPAPPSSIAPSGYVTRLESAGFQPLPDGATRVIRSGERKQ
jgi:hypothetical protein